MRFHVVQEDAWVHQADIEVHGRRRVLDGAAGTTGVEELARKIYAGAVPVACVRRVCTVTSAPAPSAHLHAPYTAFFGA